jgi:hypothetical protein
VSQPSGIPEASSTKIQLSGPPETVARLMAALAALRPGGALGPGGGVVQSTPGLDPGRWHALGKQVGAGRLEDFAAAALTASR